MTRSAYITTLVIALFALSMPSVGADPVDCVVVSRADREPTASVGTSSPPGGWLEADAGVLRVWISPAACDNLTGFGNAVNSAPDTPQLPKLLP